MSMAETAISAAFAEALVGLSGRRARQRELLDELDLNLGEEEAAAMAERTYGERAVGLDFNPSADPTVAHLKQLFAKIIDICDEARRELPAPNGGDQGRLYSIAITEAQGAQMWAVKAATWKYAGEDGRAP